MARLVGGAVQCEVLGMHVLTQTRAALRLVLVAFDRLDALMGAVCVLLVVCAALYLSCKFAMILMRAICEMLKRST